MKPQNLIKKINSFPEEIRRFFALGSILIMAAFIFVIWNFTISSKLIPIAPNSTAYETLSFDSQESLSEIPDESSPLQGIGQSFASLKNFFTPLELYKTRTRLSKDNPSLTEFTVNQPPKNETSGIIETLKIKIKWIAATIAGE